MIQKKYKTIDEMGLHARPASLLVAEANKFQSEINIVAKGKEVNMKSIMMVMTLGIVKNEEFTIKADGVDEEDALNALDKLIVSEKLA
ncbi:HPr family phosphocarrier protein [Mycoplasmatota bacterium WC44]